MRTLKTLTLLLFLATGGGLVAANSSDSESAQRTSWTPFVYDEAYPKESAENMALLVLTWDKFEEAVRRRFVVVDFTDVAPRDGGAGSAAAKFFVFEFPAGSTVRMVLESKLIGFRPIDVVAYRVQVFRQRECWTSSVYELRNDEVKLGTKLEAGSVLIVRRRGGFG